MTELIYPLIFPLIGLIIFIIGVRKVNEFFLSDLKDEKEDDFDDKSRNKYKNNNK